MLAVGGFRFILIQYSYSNRLDKQDHVHGEYRLQRLAPSERTLVVATLGAAAGSMPGETYDVFAGSAIDDAVDVGGGVHRYAIQYRNHAGSGGYNGNHYDGADTGAEHQMVVFGIV